MNPFFFHGGQIDAARAAYPQAQQPWLDLSTGINPLAWPVPPSLASDLRALPSATALAALEATAARAFGSERLAIAALPGAEIGLHLLATIGLPAPVRIVAPAYGSYAHALADARAIPAAAIEAEARDGGTILLANPNNPDGRVIDPARLIGIARTLAGRSGALVIDEAFADGDPAISVLPHVQAGDRILVLRSFGKFYGLAGVRLGFACGDAALVGALRRRIGSWPVSANAIAIGTAAYADADWARAACVDIAARAARLDALLARQGLDAIGDCPLFRLFETSRAPALFDRLARAGILTRPFDYRADWLRIGLPGEDAAFKRLEVALDG